MMKFKKGYNLKIISVMISVSLLSVNTLLPCPLSEENNSLRVPVGRGSIYDVMREEMNKKNPVLPVKAERAIYREKYIEIVKTVYEKFKASLDPEIRKLINPKLIPGIIYQAARKLEKGEIAEADLQINFESNSLRAVKLYEKSRTPTESEYEIIFEAIDIVSSYCDNYKLPFSNFNSLVRFYSVSPDEKRKVSEYFNLTQLIFVPEGFSREETLLILVHEIFHNMADNIPIEWLNEGLTEYLGLKAYIEYHNIQIENKSVELTNSPEVLKYIELLSEYANYGKISSYAFRKGITEKKENGYIAFYFGNVAIIENLVNNILPNMKIDPERLLHTYMKLNIDSLMDIFGEDCIVFMENLQELQEKKTSALDKSLTLLLAQKYIVSAMSTNIDNLLDSKAAYKVTNEAI